MAKILPLPKTRVPIVKFSNPVHGVSCDVCVNKLLGPRNTRLLCAYAEVSRSFSTLFSDECLTAYIEVGPARGAARPAHKVLGEEAEG